MKLVWHINVDAYRSVVVLLSVYLFVNLWTHFHYVILMGLDRIWTITGILGCENALMILLSVLLIPRMQIAGMALAYLLASLALPTWLLPKILKGRYADFASLQSQHELSHSQP